MYIKEFFIDFISFAYKQAYACLFWAFMLGLMTITKYYYPLSDILYRYDFLFISAILFQLFLILTKLESWREIWVIFFFHIIATGMEIFKTHPSIGSWTYPEPFILWIMSFPLFAGFMYSAVGSYIARVWRIFHFRFENFPRKFYTIILWGAIYINFFTHHYIFDFRYIILIWVLILFWKTRIYYTPRKKEYSMNLAFWFFLVSFFIWIAENIATYMNIWIYPHQMNHWNIVWPEKIIAWYLLMIISFVLVSLLHKTEKCNKNTL